MTKDFKIATFGSHSALQILKGAKDEGFKTICICLKGRDQPYRSFKVADEIIIIDSYYDYFKIENDLIKNNAILIPHASMIAYLGNENIKKIKANYFGDKHILDVESDREKQRTWLMNSGLITPKKFQNPEDIDRLCIVKFHGASGGKGYFLTNSKEDFNKKIDSGKKFIIQEYIVGVPVYIHYFYSPIKQELELMGFDKRYESNVDSIGRIAAKDQIHTPIETSYNITGNMPLVLRESLLPEVFKMGESVVKISNNLTSKGLFGPFCLETVITPDLEIFVFEISARIVAGTNISTNGSPYTFLRYDEPMSTGRRIAREIKQAIKLNQLNKVLG